MKTDYEFTEDVSVESNVEYLSIKDLYGNLIYSKDSDGLEQWYNEYGFRITKKEFDSIHDPCYATTV